MRGAFERLVGAVPKRLVEPSNAAKLHAAAAADGAGASALRHVQQQVLLLGNLEHRCVGVGVGVRVGVGTGECGRGPQAWDLTPACIGVA